MIDKLASRLTAVQKARAQSLTEVDDQQPAQKDELQAIDEILATSRKHSLAELPPAPHSLSAVQVRDTCWCFYTQHVSTVHHLLCVSASRVLMATGFANGKCQR